MVTDTDNMTPHGPRGPQGQDVARSSAGRLHRPSLPRFTPWAVLVIAAGLAWLCTVLLTGGFNWTLFGIGTVLIYVVVIQLISRWVEGARRATDRTVTAIVVTAFALALLPLASVVWTVLSRGLERFDVEFFTFSMRGILGEGGGIYHALLGTLLVTLLTALISVPIGIMTAIYLVEYGRGALARAITFFVDVMTGIPSIVAGLFAYSLFALIFGPGIRMGAMGAVALSVLMIPVVVKSAEEMLKLVPNHLREASYALGVPKWRTIVKIVLPTSAAGIATGVTLAIARVIGETAPLLVTVGITSGTNLSLFDGRIATLPVFAYYEYVTPGVPPDPYLDRAWSAALLLIIIVMALNLLARLISRVFSQKTP